MRLSELVEINEKGIVASSVNFKMMDDPEINQRLCEGFIFNYNDKNPTISTVGILDILRRSYHSRNEANIHLVIQQYGKGKSHLAIAIANYFKQSFDSPEVQGILHQIDNTTNGKSPAISESLRLYKQNQQHSHLVICLSGDRGGDLKKHFLQTLLKSLEEARVQDSIAQHICSEPLSYLEGLKLEDRNKAEDYLTSLGNPDGDLNSIIRLLRENNASVISSVKEICKHLTRVTPDFSAEIDIEAILEDLLKNTCSGANRQFDGILILFDELNYYLQSWAADQIGAGGTALQNITNLCERYKSKIALLSFTQIHPAQARILGSVKDSYEKISSRLAPKDTTYYPESSLELVLNNLLIQKENSQEWEDFSSRWRNTLFSEARTAYEKRIKIYRNKGWSFDQFYRYLSQGCFPLHPLTAYLLCNLAFTQDRTAIQFIKGYVKEFLSTQSLEHQGKLNYIYPIALVDTFIENFANDSIYPFYQKAKELILDTDDTNELTVLKALFLYYSSGENLSKSDYEDHQEILATLTGLSPTTVKASFDKLISKDIIYYKPEAKLYRFFEGVNPTDIEKEIEEEIRDKHPSLNDLVAYTQTNITSYLGDKTLAATKFVNNRKLVGDDWQFEYKIYSINGLIKDLSSPETSKKINTKGIFAYVLAETKEELTDFRQNIHKYLTDSSFNHQIAVAIPNQETGDLAKVLLKFNTLKNKNDKQKSFLGTAYQQLLQRLDTELNTRLRNILKDCNYYCTAIDKITLSDRNYPQKIISALLEESYYFVPSVKGIDKMRSGHTTGAKITGWVAKQLLNNSLTLLLPDKAHKTVIDQIFVSSWHLLTASSQKYTVQEPTETNVKAAWDLISQMTELKGLQEKIVNLKTIWQTLSESPYGYNEFTFTVLLAGWLAYHSKEVVLQGADKITLKKNEQATIKTQSLKDWANTDIWQKPKDFIDKWVCQSSSKLIRRQRLPIPTLPESPMDYEKAQKYLKEIDAFLKSNESDEFIEVTKYKQKVIDCVGQIDAWFKPVEEAEIIFESVSLDDFLPFLSQLQQSLPPIDLRPDVISVQPTKQQRDRHTEAVKKVNEQIENIIRNESKLPQSFSTESECDNYQEKNFQRLQQLQEVSNFPPHLVEIIHNSLNVADQTKIKIQQQSKEGQEKQEKQTEDQKLIQFIRQLNPAKTVTLHQCEEGIKTIKKLTSQLNYPEQWNPEIEEILNTLREKIDSHQRNLITLRERLLTINSLKNLEQLRIEYNQLDLIFKDSTQYETYQALSEPIQILIQLLQLSELGTNITIEGCQIKLNTLNEWKENLESITPQLQERFDSFYQEIETVHQQLIEQQRQKAKEWVKVLEEEGTKLCQIIDDTERFKKAEQLLKQIQEQKADYTEFLSTQDKQSLAYVERECLEERSKSKSNQILVLFQQLPRLQRQALYNQLATYLLENTEDFNG